MLSTDSRGAVSGFEFPIGTVVADEPAIWMCSRLDPLPNMRRQSRQKYSFYSISEEDDAEGFLDSRTTLIGTNSRRHGQRPSISRNRVQLRKVRTRTNPARSPRLVKVSSIAIVLTISAATSTSRPSSSDLPMRILY